MSEIEEFVFTLKNDYAFKRLLGAEENKAILQDFLACVLDIPHENFADCKLLDKELNKDAKEEKTGILDIKIRLKDRTYIDMEMQFMWDDSFVLRSIFYVAKMYIEDFRTGSSYSKLHKCISINVIAEGYNLDDEIHSTYYLINPKTQKKLTDAIEFHFLNLEKVRELPIEYGNTDSVKICSQFGLKKSLNLKLFFAPYPIQFFVLKVYYHLYSMYLKNDLQSIQPN